LHSTGVDEIPVGHRSRRRGLDRTEASPKRR
jgi:hypothetical protein